MGDQDPAVLLPASSGETEQQLHIIKGNAGTSRQTGGIEGEREQGRQGRDDPVTKASSQLAATGMPTGGEKHSSGLPGVSGQGLPTGTLQAKPIRTAHQPPHR